MQNTNTKEIFFYMGIDTQKKKIQSFKPFGLVQQKGILIKILWEEYTHYS